MEGGREREKRGGEEKKDFPLIIALALGTEDRS
jgi:hypothetical protein